LPAKTSSAAHEIRIIGGRYKRSLITVADAPGLRPTPNRVRETLFNWLGQSLEGLHCVDAYAGTGALGIEAISRGAANLIFIEQQLSVSRVLEANLKRLKIEQAQVRTADALQALASLPAASQDVVFIDPPFDEALQVKAAQAAHRVLKVSGALYIEAPSDKDHADIAALGFVLHKAAKAGAVHFALFLKAQHD
jgi:16S rRNA (guanine966-N2)-methyltransferase